MGVNEEENVQKEAFEDFIFGSVKCIWRCNFYVYVYLIIQENVLYL